ncbi:carboxypeptidase regulatory-like domain-containing protein [Pyxidicoccus fallax]|uniref:Carboxypeptidase regulatory-like domain-containing protein n=1 Tax=Pyxidicoccus fallax TaxID=394095 RepID=A0A848LKI4_9BACT|nr:carboxypeptidase regulatory-like domain-containing protein [Pyxidicoccus fallax]NMO18228.1 carboxypeptidase regulatory-like domain-containing protein [Pyxidicoccus fallax]NPC80146.1 carboxypeptidase regulatory-like domain-containing protein [Pyxidicoccus fallax]
MKRPFLIATCVLLGLASGCGSDGATPDPGVRTEDAEAVDLDNLRIRVRGRAEVLPEATRLLEARGQPVPSLAGVPVTIEEPLRVAVNDANATFGAGALAEAGDFDVNEVPVREVHQSLAVGLSAPGLVRTATVIYDTTFTGGRPRTDLIDARAWALPEAFHDALTAALGESRLRGHTGDKATTLRDAGFVLGRVVDANGHPVAGMRVTLDRSELADRVYYPTADFSGVGQDGTGADGLFLYVHSAGDAETFRLSVDGADTYVPRNVGAAPGWGLVLTVYPGQHPPP